MTERENIIELIEKFQRIFEVTNMDVVESPKGQWLFTRFEPEYEYYDAIVHFKTAKELAEILLGELSTDILSVVDEAPEEKPKFLNFADDLTMIEEYKPYIERALEYLGK